MTNPYRKRRGPWIDLLLIGAIGFLGAIIVFLTFLSDDPIFRPSDKTSAKEHTITEEASKFPGVKIVTDRSDDKKMPYTVQYPLTEYEAFNNAVTAYIEQSKQYYISMMRLQQDSKKLTGDLTITVETFKHNHYYSFVITNKTILNTEEKQTTIQTFLIDYETGDLFDIRDLLNEDLESLKTFAAHIQSEILKNPTYKEYVLEKELAFATEPKWRLFKRFALKDDSLFIYFNEGEVAKPEAGVPVVEIPLSFINPLLASDFQIAMQSENTIIPSDKGSSKKRIALTFDDGPHPEVTKQILVLLEKYNAKATFFMLGSRAQYYPGLVREVLDSGHELGNHTWSHPVLTKMSPAEIEKEYNSTEEAIIHATGENSTVFRPPYGAINEEIRNAIPCKSVNWTIDTLDWKYRDSEKLFPMVKEVLHNNAIVLMHDIHQSTADGLEPVLAYLQKEGYEFLTVSEILPYH
ncbi:polysaccharide deacetylase family protein [Solibacillus isronensis]|uniref:polysaccharide deacetylase family protein n=1 Tax=Solibacillus isronensis TaxID=412383 RepID=UPI0009A69E1A|nr:polysaccharide deacetylase family protein [Solibacillus isronensis]